ncbi:winged helix-turn-helix transcriptional regulator [Herpetosiphon geysericola]|nr:winged helix-turn-helix transcriptional regulator [Herpetosiphon geysericola]
MMNNRSYNQYCGLSYALEILGERWTILVIRELIAGPRRFKDLLNGLPGISTNLLTERLKHLEQQGLIGRQVLAPPAGSTVYGLTDVGRGLEPSLLELGKWGSQFIPVNSEHVHLLNIGSYALTLKTFFRPQQAQFHERYQWHVDGELLSVTIDHGQLIVQQGPSQQPAIILHTTIEHYLQLLQGALTPEQAIAQGLVQVQGEPSGLTRFLRCCAINPPE